MKICIIGGGNIGTAMAVMAGQNKDVEVVIHTSKPQLWSRQLEMIDPANKRTYTTSVSAIHSELEYAVKGCSIIFITHPSFMVKQTLEAIAPHLEPNAMIGIIPGYGGAEFFAEDLIRAGHTVFGTDRVPCIARVTEYGKLVIASPKQSVRLCAMPSNQTLIINQLFSKLFGIKCLAVKNYLSITLTPSNPILHSARLYTMFLNREDEIWPQIPLFYREWDDKASEMLLGCDQELQRTCSQLSDLNLEVIPLTQHYESRTSHQLTQKMQTIQSLKDIKSPMKKVDGGYQIDLSSRYFAEDIPYGLCILKGFAEICGIGTPHMDTILKWYEKLMDVCLFCNLEFTGKDLCLTPVPQNFSINTIQDIYAFYRRVSIR